MAIALQRGRSGGGPAGWRRASPVPAGSCSATSRRTSSSGRRTGSARRRGRSLGGRRRALSLLRATFPEPRILLLDEHAAALDPQRADLVSRPAADIVAEQKPAADIVAEQKRSMTVAGLLAQVGRLRPAADRDAFDDATLFESVKTEERR